jgi:hypothetical protein
MRHTAASRHPDRLLRFLRGRMPRSVGPYLYLLKRRQAIPKGWRRFRIYVNRPVFLASGIADEASHGTTTSKKRALWRKISTIEDTEWTRRYHGCDPREKASGGRVVITTDDGSVLGDEIAYEI